MRILSQQHWRAWARHPTVRLRGGLIHPGVLDLFGRQTCGLIRHLWRETLRGAAAERYKRQFAALSLFFIKNDAINAVALEEGDRRGVGVNIGLPRNIWALARLALGQGEFMAASFKSPPPDPSFDPARADAWAHLYADPADHWPANRSSHLFELFMYASEFLLCHELAHHARGHLDYLRRSLDGAAIDEALSLSASEETEAGKILQMLEFDADHHALDIILRRHMGNGLGDRGRDYIEEDLFKTTLSVILVFMAFDLRHHAIDEGYRGSHPAPVHRAMRLAEAIFAAYESLFDLA